jgi:hypothetical protein
MCESEAFVLQLSLTGKLPEREVVRDRIDWLTRCPGWLASETAGETFAWARFIDPPFPRTTTPPSTTSDAAHAHFVMAAIPEQAHV